MFNQRRKKTKEFAEVKFTCRDMKDKLSMKKYYGTLSENFIFWRKEFEDNAQSCNWTAAEGTLQLKRALVDQALQEYLDKGPFDNIGGGLDSLQSHFIGANAYREYSGQFRQHQQQSSESVQEFVAHFTDLLHCCNCLAPSEDDKISSIDRLNRFMDSLNDDIATTVALLKVKTLGEAITVAKQAEQSQNNKRKVYNNKKTNPITWPY